MEYPLSCSSVTVSPAHLVVEWAVYDRGVAFQSNLEVLHGVGRGEWRTNMHTGGVKFKHVSVAD